MKAKPATPFSGVSHVLSRDGRQKGEVIGHRACTMEGCRGEQVTVRWGPKQRTYICLKAVEETDTAGLVKLI